MSRPATGWVPAAKAVIEKAVLPLLIVASGVAWLVRPEAFIGDDCYFYLVIARRLALTGQQTFSGVFPTNGFHPLWGYLLAAYDRLVAFIDPGLLWNVRTALPLVLTLSVLTAWCLLRVAQQMKLPPLPLIGIPLLLLVMNRVLYSEAVLLALMLACLMLVSVNGMLERRYGALVGGLSCAGVFLARLDSVFLLAAWGCWYLITVRRVGRMVQMTAVFMVVVLPYLLFNLVHFGGLMPVSGWMKTSFPRVCLKGFDVSQGIYASTFGGYRIVWGLVPILVGLTALVIRRRNGRQVHGLLMVLLCGSILHFAYIALFVRSHTMWAWYYVVPATLMGLSAAVLLADRPALHSGLALMVLLAGVVVAAKAARSSTKEEALWPPQAESLRFAAAHHLSNRVILVSDWPGCLAFYTNNRVVAADLITANRPLYETIRRSPNALGDLFDRCALAGAPVEYLITMGNSWLVPDPDRRGLVYNDPRAYPRPLPIGHVAMPRDPIEVAWGGGFLAWEVRARD